MLWGAGGALVASLIWTATVLTVPGMVAHDVSVPGIGSYHAVDDLCATARLPKFGELFATLSGTPYHYTTRHRALDEMYCSQYRRKAGGEGEYYSIYLDAQLHKAVDPRAEFEAQRAGLQQRRYQIRAVPNLGQDAYLGYLDDPGAGDRSTHYLTQVLYVRQGGLTFFASWSGSYQDGKSTPPARTDIEQALVNDVRDALRSIDGTP